MVSDVIWSKCSRDHGQAGPLWRRTMRACCLGARVPSKRHLRARRSEAQPEGAHTRCLNKAGGQQVPFYGSHAAARVRLPGPRPARAVAPTVDKIARCAARHPEGRCASHPRATGEQIGPSGSRDCVPPRAPRVVACRLSPAPPYAAARRRSVPPGTARQRVSWRLTTALN